MRGRKGHFRTLLAGIITLSLFATMLMATLPGSVSASPTWQVGDKWALAGEKDIGQIWDTLAPLITSGYNAAPPTNLTLSSASFHGKLTMDALFEVTAITASEITIQIKIAANVTISAHAVMNGNFYAPGAYNWSTSPSPTYLNKDITFSSQLVAGSSGTLTVVTTSDTMSIKSFDATVSAYAKGFFSVSNYPSYAYNQAYTEFVVSYPTFNSSVDMNALTGMHATVSPAIQVISDTMVTGEVRDAFSNVTASETISGSMDMGNIPTSVRDAYFTSSTARYGITGFPLNLAKIYNPYPDGMPINNGTIASSTGSMETHIAYLRNTNVNDAVTGSVQAREYAMQQGDSSEVFTFLLNPVNGHALGSTSTIPMGEAQVIFTTHAAPVGSTQTNITTINKQVNERQSYATVTGTAGGTTGGALGISSDLLIIIAVIVIIAVAVIAGVVVMRRKK